MTDQKAQPTTVWGGVKGTDKTLFLSSSDGSLSATRTDKTSIYVDAKGQLWRKMEGVTLWWRPESFKALSLPELGGQVMGEQIDNFGVNVKELKNTTHEQVSGTSLKLQEIIAGVEPPETAEHPKSIVPPDVPWEQQGITVTPLGLGVAAILVVAGLFIVVMIKGAWRGAERGRA